MSRSLWAAVESLADVWRGSKIVQRYAEVFADSQQGLGRALMETVSRADGIQQQRLLLVHLVPASAGYSSFLQEPGAAEFLQRGERLAQTFLWTVEWWRSRLPGYPIMPAPQLVRNGPLTTRELTFRIPWPQDLRRQGLQRTPSPPSVARLLGVPQQRLDEATRAVGAALAGCPQVRTLEQAYTTLTDDDRVALASARAQARTALQTEHIDAMTGVLDRLNYREAAVAEALEGLRGGARQYSDAFEAADRLVEQAGALFSQAVVNGPAPKVGPVLRAERLRGGDGWTEVAVSGLFALLGQLGDVVLFDTPALPDAMHVEGMVQAFKPEGWPRATLRGRLLPDSTGLRATRVPNVPE